MSNIEQTFTSALSSVGDAGPCEGGLQADCLYPAAGNANGHDVAPEFYNVERTFKVNASLMLVTLLAVLGIAAECVTLWLFKANKMTSAPSIPKQIKDPVIGSELGKDPCLVGGWKQDETKGGMMNRPMERYTRFLEDNPGCFPLFDENLGDEGIISIAGIASPSFIMSIPQWEMVFGI